jgi:GT2 family glycosyltransferase
MSKPSVYAVVINWNGLGVIGDCLRSLERSDYEDLTTLVVDNASTDGSPDLIRKSFRSVRLVETGENLRYAGGANTGLRLALESGADYVLLLNNDIEIAPDAISELIRVAANRRDAALLGPKIYYHEPRDLIWSMGGSVSFWSGKISHLGLRSRDVGQYERVTDVDYLTGCALFVPVATLRSVGYLDESYHMYNEDTDWCARAGRLGLKCVVVPSAHLWHKVSTSSGGGLTPYKVYHRIRSTMAFFRRYARPYHWFGIIPATAVRTLGFALKGLVTGKRENVSAAVRGALDAAGKKGRTERYG